MFNLALASAFLLSIIGPGRWLLGFLVGAHVPHDIFDLGVPGDLHAGARGVIIAIFDYWLPAVLIYAALRCLPQAARFRPSRVEVLVLAGCNISIALFLFVRIGYASDPHYYEGLGLLVGIPMVFAVFIVGIVVLKILVRGLRSAPEGNDAEPAGVREAWLIAVLGTVPLAFALGSLYPIENSAFSEIRASAEGFDELCRTARESITPLPADVEGIFLANEGTMGFERTGPGAFVQHGQGSMDPRRLLDSGRLRYLEARRYVGDSRERQLVRISRSGGTTKYQSVPVGEVSARYEVYFAFFAAPAGPMLRLQGFEQGIRDRNSGETISSTRYFMNLNGRQVCADKSLEKLDWIDFIDRALNART